MSPAQRFAMKVTRFMHDTGIKQEAPAGDLAGLLSSRAKQSERGDARTGARRGEIRCFALDHRTVFSSV